MAGRHVLSEEARRGFSSLLDEVEHHAAHITVLRYKTPAAVIVPPEWYERACRALGEAPEPDPPPR